MRRTLRSLGEGGWKGFGEFRKIPRSFAPRSFIDNSDFCSFMINEYLREIWRFDLQDAVLTKNIWDNPGAMRS